MRLEWRLCCFNTALTGFPFPTGTQKDRTQQVSRCCSKQPGGGEREVKGGVVQKNETRMSGIFWVINLSNPTRAVPVICRMPPPAPGWRWVISRTLWWHVGSPWPFFYTSHHWLPLRHKLVSEIHVSWPWRMFMPVITHEYMYGLPVVRLGAAMLTHLRYDMAGRPRSSILDDMLLPPSPGAIWEPARTHQ